MDIVVRHEEVQACIAGFVLAVRHPHRLAMPVGFFVESCKSQAGKEFG